jgi:hypothetical protein
VADGEAADFAAGEALAGALHTLPPMRPFVLVLGVCLVAACGGVDPTAPVDPPGPKSTDICKDGGDPEVIVGHGFGDYLPADDGDVAQVEAGPQGGFHIWIGARVKNLLRSGSITEITGSIPDASLDLEEQRLIFTLDPGEGGYCEVHGLRLIVANDSESIGPLLGLGVDVEVSVADPDGDLGVGVRHLVLSQDIIGQ